MRWFWIALGVVLALALGAIALPNFIRVKYGPQRVRVLKFSCEPAAAAADEGAYTFTVTVMGSPDPRSVVVQVAGESYPANDGTNTVMPQGGPAPPPIPLHNDGVAPDAQVGDRLWTGTGSIEHSVGPARSVCVVLQQGKYELIWLAPPLELKP